MCLSKWEKAAKQVDILQKDGFMFSYDNKTKEMKFEKTGRDWQTYIRDDISGSEESYIDAIDCVYEDEMRKKFIPEIKNKIKCI